MSSVLRVRIPGVVLRYLLAAYWLAMFIGTHIPSRVEKLEEEVFDKFVHFGAFAGLAFLFAWNWEHFGGRLTFRHYLIITIVLAIYGVLDEYLQIYVHRDCDLYDWLSDVAGAVVGLWLFHICRPSLKLLVSSSE